MSKGPFFYWTSQNGGTGPTALLQTFIEHYTNLSAAYLQKGMKREAKVFEEVVEEFKAIEKEMNDPLGQFVSP